eukprot:g7421.t1
MGSRPWTEKYRPKHFTDIVHQDNAVKLLQSATEKQTIPHMLFHGPPGTGKTSGALLVAKKLFGNHWKQRVLEMNASDDRGIDVVRQQIKQRASQSIFISPELPEFQLIILDEADCMTRDAQKALLRTMEVFSGHTRFIVICNYVSRIISPLASRCAKIRFQSLPSDVMVRRLEWICDKEDVQIEPSCFEVLIQAAKGDLRRAIMLLQSAAKFNQHKISKDDLLDLSGIVGDEIVESCLEESEKSPSASYAKVKSIVNDGYSVQQILFQLTNKILHSSYYNEVQKANILEVIAKADHNLSVGANETLQLLLVGSMISKQSI